MFVLLKKRLQRTDSVQREPPFVINVKVRAKPAASMELSRKLLLLCLLVFYLMPGSLTSSTPGPTTQPKTDTKTPVPEPTSEPETGKPEPEDKSPSAEEIANYTTLGVLVGVFFITSIVFGVLWWKVRRALKQVQTSSELPQKPGLTV